MEASLDTPRKLEGEKAQRIVEAMRVCVGKRGAAGSTFDVVAREAGVSRGLLHYYFGSKERLMVEVVRTDCDARVAALEQQLAGAGTVDEIVGVLVHTLESFVAEPDVQAVLYEMLSASRHSEEIRAELAGLYTRWRTKLADALLEKERAGVVTLDAEPEAIASLLFGLGDGIGLQLISDPEWDSRAALELGVRTARRLLGASA
ncbi:MAG: TetR/AcrR family transcriptional regulator [Thermoleophilaceae bacterium]